MDVNLRNLSSIKAQSVMSAALFSAQWTLLIGLKSLLCRILLFLCAICLPDLMRLIYDASIHPGPVTALHNLHQKERLAAIIYFYSPIL